jgi:hypothetical protein
MDFAELWSAPGRKPKTSIQTGFSPRVREAACGRIRVHIFGGPSVIRRYRAL